MLRARWGGPAGRLPLMVQRPAALGHRIRCPRCPDCVGESGKRLADISVAENLAERIKKRACRADVERDGVGQHHRVGLGVGQVERTAQHMAELVMQRHADLSQNGAT